MEFFEPTRYGQHLQHQPHHLQHPHPQSLPNYHLEQTPHYTDAQHVYAMHQSGPMIAMPHVAKANETKPRLGRDEVDILEREFQKNPKPTTQTKRQFAEDMGVDLSRINNWFQNRRAKRKQERRQEESEAGQARDASGYSEPSSPDFYNNTGNGYYSDNSQITPMGQPSATFPVLNGPPPPAAPYNPQYMDPSTASIESLHRTMAAGQTAPQQDEYGLYTDGRDPIATPGFEVAIRGFSGSDRAQFPPPDGASNNFNSTHSYSYPLRFQDSMYLNSSQSQSLTENPSPEAATNHTATSFDSFQNPTSEASIPQLMATFSLEHLTPQVAVGLPQNDNQFTQSPKSMQESTPGFKYEVEESEEPSVLPPAPSGALFKSPPPPMDIASRRKKVHVKPAALVAENLRGRPPVGLRTASQAESFRRPTESPASSPMRRIVSAGANRNVISGRIHKSGIESSQRSPINLSGFAGAGSFIEHNYQSILNAPQYGGSSLNALNGSLAPPTPMSPQEREMTFANRDGTRSTASPVEENVIFNAGSNCFSTIEGDRNLASPPETPHAPMIATTDGWANALDVSDKSWQYDVPDEPLYTPAQDSFSLEIHRPQPSYMSSMSLPVTPAFAAQSNPNFMFGNDSPPYKNEPSQFPLSAQSGPEYLFPDSQQNFLSPSPSFARQKTFQFSHTTAADFSEK